MCVCSCVCFVCGCLCGDVWFAFVGCVLVNDCFNVFVWFVCDSVCDRVRFWCAVWLCVFVLLKRVCVVGLRAAVYYGLVCCCFFLRMYPYVCFVVCWCVCLCVVCLMSLCGLIVTHCVKSYGLFGLFCVRCSFACVSVVYVLGCNVCELVCDDVCCLMCPVVCCVFVFNVVVWFVCDSLCNVVWTLFLCVCGVVFVCCV